VASDYLCQDNNISYIKTFHILILICYFRVSSVIVFCICYICKYKQKKKKDEEKVSFIIIIISIIIISIIIITIIIMLHYMIERVLSMFYISLDGLTFSLL